MGIEYFTGEAVTVIRVCGSLDYASADALREGVYAALRRRQRTVFVNLDNVPAIDAAGLGVLAHIHQMAVIVGAGLALTNVRPRVRNCWTSSGSQPASTLPGRSPRRSKSSS